MLSEVESEDSASSAGVEEDEAESSEKLSEYQMMNHQHKPLPI